MIDPLLTSEIPAQVSQLFSPAEASAPARVCPLWNGVFAAVVRRTYHADCNTKPGIERNAHHIRDFTSISQGCFPVSCIRLTSITFDRLHFGPSGRGTAVDEFSLQLVRQNPQLQYARIKRQECEPPAEFWFSTIILKSLSVSGLIFTGQTPVAFWCACKYLSPTQTTFDFCRGQCQFFQISSGDLSKPGDTRVRLLLCPTSGQFLMRFPNLHWSTTKTFRCRR